MSDGLIYTLVALLYCGGAIYYANHLDLNRQRSTILNWLLYIILFAVLIVGSNLIIFAANPEATAAQDLPPVSMAAGIAGFAVAAFAITVGGLLVASEPARIGLRQILRPEATYNPESNVHLVAAVMALAMVSVTISQVILSGGLEGLADTISAEGLSLPDVLFQGFLWVVLALLGVGFAIRRGVPDTLNRLGLRWPTIDDIRAGIGSAVVLFMLAFLISALWTILIPPDQIEQQTAAMEAISQAVSSLALAFAISFAAAVGEEIFFRGAVQPVFGLPLTSLFFALIHAQYTATPATLLIIAVGLVLGWVRQRYSTTAAIIAHFLYNFVQLVSVLLAASMTGSA